MKYNVGLNDRLVRIIIGLIIAILGIVFKSWWGLLGVVLLATGLLKYCALYDLLKISTIKKKEE